MVIFAAIGSGPFIAPLQHHDGGGQQQCDAIGHDQRRVARLQAIGQPEQRAADRGTRYILVEIALVSRVLRMSNTCREKDPVVRKAAQSPEAVSVNRTVLRAAHPGQHDDSDWMKHTCSLIDHIIE